MGSLTNDFYKKYIGQYAKRFYTSFEEKNIFKIVDFELRYNSFFKRYEAYFQCRDEKYADFTEYDGYEWWWDVEDCVIISNEQLADDDERVIKVSDPAFKGFNPFTKQIIK